MRRHSGFRESTLIPLLTMAVVGLGACAKDRITSPERGLGAAQALESAALASALRSQDDALLQHCPGGAEPIRGPVVIEKPGLYRVTRDFTADPATGDGIVIRASGVLLWLGEHTIEGLGTRVGRGIVLDNVRNVLVQGGRLERFGVGVVLDRSVRCAVRGVQVAGADEFADPPGGIPPQIGVLLLDSSQNRIARNRLDEINLGLFVRGAGSHDNVLRHNEVVGGRHGLLGVCYNPASGAGPAGPTNDRVVGNRLSRFGGGIQASAGSAMNYFIGNTIEYFTFAWEDLNGTNAFRANETIQIMP
jgi:nitrous oxidase accessory protein NosD